MSETPETRKLEHDAAITKPPLEIPLSTRMLNTKWSKTRTLSQRHRGDKNKPVRLSSSWKGGDTAFSKMHVSHKKKATDGPGWKEKRHGVHSDRDTAAWRLGQGCLKSLVADSLGMDQHLHFGSRKRTRSCWYEFARES